MFIPATPLDRALARLRFIGLLVELDLRIRTLPDSLVVVRWT